ncbi:hypothetical protein EXIGLDRAFT_701547 [Exidia glandulosa HHB12029]|uniref:Uncharacterized protein n=1 Tax=Exidia glandulosa HHB12029 TaxID=1314781 RepID=A0A165CWM6_EXIGL|nr:hypothetical protein EXIGLDRAFT_701547 [Exidia glandulosa HHB12029]
MVRDALLLNVPLFLRASQGACFSGAKFQDAAPRPQKATPHSEVFNKYSRLLEAPCRGHALYEPLASPDGGEIGDAGVVKNGRFHKLFNVYEKNDRFPANISPLSKPLEAVDILQTLNDNTESMRSSTSSSVTYNGSASPQLPQGVPPSQLNVKFNVNDADSEFAFLACTGPHYVTRSLHELKLQELERWITTNHRELRRAFTPFPVFITETVKASGWVGGISYEETRASGAEKGRKVELITRGPADPKWTEKSALDHTVVIGFATARDRSTLRKGRSAPLPAGPSEMRGEHDAAPSRNPEKDEYESTLNAVLDNTLEAESDADVIVGSWSIVSKYIAENGKCPDRSTHRCDVILETLDNGGETERVMRATAVVSPDDRPPLPDPPEDASRPVTQYYDAVPSLHFGEEEGVRDSMGTVDSSIPPVLGGDDGGQFMTVATSPPSRH